MKSIFYALLFTLTIPLGTGMALAQVNPVYTLSPINASALNPAFAGTHDGMCHLYLDARKQWMNVHDAPLSGSLNAHYFLEKINSGLGLGLNYDQIGGLKTTEIKLAYNYQIFLDEARSGWLAIAMQPKIANQSLYLNLGDNQELLSDVAMINGQQSVYKLDGDLGVAYTTDYYRVGVNAENILENAAKFQKENQESYALKGQRLYGFFADYTWKLPYKNLKLVPAIYVKYTERIPWQFDFQFRGTWKDLLSLGFNYRKQDSYSILAGFHIKEKVDLYYAYDKTFSNLKLSSQGSHELMLAFHFSTVKK